MGHPLSLLLHFPFLLNKNLAGQSCQSARSQRVLHETPGLGRPRRIHLHAFDAQLQGALDVAKFHDFNSGGQSCGAAGEAGTTGAADTVDEVFCHLGQIVVDDVGDVVTM